MGSKIYILEILNHLQHRPYIEYITGFSLVHFFKVWNQKDGRLDAHLTDTSVDLTDSLQGSVPGAILISADDHQLTVINQSKPENPTKSGIGDFSVGSDLLIIQPQEIKKDTDIPSSTEELYDFTVYPH
ncbi:hypothetical protein [Pedobacter sp. NJ-S-72]